MAAEPLESLHLTLMQEVLPVGLAMVDRVRRDGPRGVMAAFDTNGSDPLNTLRREGEAAARQVRDSLDQLQPGLGNPVMHVSVRDVPTEAPPDQSPHAAKDPVAADPHDPAELQQALLRIQQRLDLLEQGLPGSDPPAAGARSGRS